MATITALKTNIQLESLQTGGAASEVAVQSLGQNVQFIQERPDYSVRWDVNGNYNVVPGIQSLIDGKRGLFKNYQVFGFMLSVDVAGSSSNLEVDIIRLTSGGSSASIFSTRPLIPASAGNDARILRRFFDSTTLVTASGATLPVLSVTNLSAGDVLSMNITSKQAGPVSGFTAELYLIGRN
jgi:hypothetical protein